LLPSVDSLDPQARAELLWTVTVTAREVGDDAMALEEFRGQDEPLGTTSAGLTLGSVETTVGR
jgi:hypothetical protein